MAIEFYNVKKKTKVSIDESKVQKVQYGETGNLRYAFSAVDDDGTKLTKFCSKANWDALKGEALKK